MTDEKVDKASRKEGRLFLGINEMLELVTLE